MKLTVSVSKMTNFSGFNDTVGTQPHEIYECRCHIFRYFNAENECVSPPLPHVFDTAVTGYFNVIGVDAGVSRTRLYWFGLPKATPASYE